jgi:hypothetical protein
LLLDELAAIEKNLPTGDYIRLCITHTQRLSLEREISAISDPPDRLLLQKPVAADQMILKKFEEWFGFVR